MATDRLTFVGHSTVLLELDGVRLLTDPALRNRLVHLRRHSAPPAADVAERIDAVLISHLHHDHLDVPSLKRVGPGVPVLAPRGAGAFLRRAGFAEVEELSAGDVARVGDVEVTALPAEHRSRRLPLIGPAAEPIGFHIRGSHGVYFAGDTDVFPGMRDLAGDVDVALLPVWGWGPKLGAGHLDPARAAQAAALVRPRTAVPIHWGTLFRLGGIPRHAHLMRDPPHEFARHVAEVAPDVEVRVLAPGESLTLAS